MRRKPPRSARLLPPLAWGVLVGLALALGLVHSRYLWFVCDDAYITFRYGENLARGLGPVFNPGERVEGYTNFLWMLLSALVSGIGGRPEEWMPRVGVACAMVTVAAVMLLAPRPGARFGGAWPGFLLAGSASFAAWSTSGLETALFTMMVTLGYLALVHRAGAAAGLALGLASLTRPEGILLGACAGAYAAFRGDRLGIPRAARWAPIACWAACVVPHLAWRVWYYGRWVPNTFAIKTPGLDSLSGGATYLADSLMRLHLYVLAIPLLALLATGVRPAANGPSAVRRGPWELLAALVLPYLAYVFTTGGDFMPLFRFVAPVLPLIAIAAGAGLDAIAGRFTRRAWGAGLGVAVVAAFAGLNLIESRHEQKSWDRHRMESVGLTRENTVRWARVAAGLGEMASPSDTLAITAAGIIPYVTRLHTIDMLGLTAPDPSIYRRRASTRPGHSYYLKGSALAALRPQYLVGHPEVRANPTRLGLTLDLEPEWEEAALREYEMIAYPLPGEPLAFLALGIRRDVAERLEGRPSSRPPGHTPRPAGAGSPR